jgi:hypothetical protein
VRGGCDGVTVGPSSLCEGPVALRCSCTLARLARGHGVARTCARHCGLCVTVHSTASNKGMAGMQSKQQRGWATSNGTCMCPRSKPAAERRYRHVTRCKKGRERRAAARSCTPTSILFTVIIELVLKASGSARALASSNSLGKGSPVRNSHKAQPSPVTSSPPLAGRPRSTAIHQSTVQRTAATHNAPHPCHSCHRIWPMPRAQALRGAAARAHARLHGGTARRGGAAESMQP